MNPAPICDKPFRLTWPELGYDQDVWFTPNPHEHVLKGVFDGMEDYLATLYVDLSGYGAIPKEGAFWIKDYSEGKGLAAALEKAGVIVPTGRGVMFGPFHTTATEVRLTPEWIAPENKA